jgi:N-glycosylase/DNA lyase
VGPKVANCIQLFGLHQIGVFPVDTWINKIIQEQYNGKFPVELYNGFAGVIQQYLFNYAVHGGIENEK